MRDDHDERCDYNNAALCGRALMYDFPVHCTCGVDDAAAAEHVHVRGENHRKQNELYAKELTSLRARLAAAEQERDEARAMVGAELLGLQMQRDEAIRRWQTTTAERDWAKEQLRLTHVDWSQSEIARRDAISDRDTARAEVEALRKELTDTRVDMFEADRQRDAAIARAESAEAERDDYRSRKDAAYDERNDLVAALARLALHNGWRAGIGKHQPDPDPTWDPEWLTVIYIETPWGQLSWHVNDRQLATFDGLPRCELQWDGHTTPEKYARLANAWRKTEGSK